MIKNKKPTIKSVIFDLGGVIVHKGYLDFIHNYCLKCLTTLGKKEILKLEYQVNIGEITEAAFYQKIKKIFGVQMSPKQMHETILKKIEVDKKLLKIIPTLKKSKIALFTNSIGTMSLETLRTRKIPAKKLFDRQFYSNIMHVAKPNTGAYEIVLKKLKVKPSESIMVDDRPENIRAAKKVGMYGILYKNATQFAKEIKKYELI